MKLLSTLSLTLLPTIVIEWGVLLLLGERRRRVLWSSVVVNVLTNVPLNLWLMSVGGFGVGHIAVGELTVVVVEALWYWAVLKDLRRAAVYSLLCNAVSYLTGLLFQLLYECFFQIN